MIILSRTNVSSNSRTKNLDENKLLSMSMIGPHSVSTTSSVSNSKSAKSFSGPSEYRERIEHIGLDVDEHRKIEAELEEKVYQAIRNVTAEKFATSGSGENRIEQEQRDTGFPIDSTLDGYNPNTGTGAEFNPENIPSGPNVQSQRDIQGQGQGLVRNPSQYRLKLVLRHVSGQPVFWDGNYSLKSHVTIYPSAMSPAQMSTTMQALLARFLPLDYFNDPSNTDAESPLSTLATANVNAHSNVTGRGKAKGNSVMSIKDKDKADKGKVKGQVGSKDKDKDKDMIKTTKSSTKPETEQVLLINDQFKAISLEEKLQDIFQPNVSHMLVYVRGLDFNRSKNLNQDQNPIVKSDFNTEVRDNMDANKSKSGFKNEVENENDEGDDETVVLEVEEASGRQILWNQSRLCFDSVTRLRLPRSQLSSLKVHEVISRIVAGRYVEARKERNALEQHLWTREIKVVGWHDTADVLFLFSSKTRLFLKLLLNKEDKQWQDILDAINVFTQKILTSDPQLRSHYHQINLLEDLRLLKRMIQSDSRDEDEIMMMMVRLEPKLNSVTSRIRIRDSEVESSSSLRASHAHARPATPTSHNNPQTGGDKHANNAHNGQDQDPTPTHLPKLPLAGTLQIKRHNKKKHPSHGNPMFYNW